ncbi:CAP domain-containing protein [Spongisporangium articulatum]|uniref:CAP domain-containing protein n=1 Tax=Spongisporangium articulatum TaxID=3362603 RepID=A0ABW8AIC3_9ACTN
MAGDRSLRRIRLVAVGASGLLVAGVAVGVAQTLPGGSDTDSLVVRSALSTAATVTPTTAEQKQTTEQTTATKPTTSTSATANRKHRSGTRTEHRTRRPAPWWPGASSRPTSKPTTSPTASPTHEPSAPSSEPAQPAPTTAKPAEASDTSFAQQVVSLTNAERAKAGCGALTADSTLTSVAQAHSADMASHNYFSHNSQDGTTPFQRMSAAGYGYRTAGENIAAGQPTPSAVVSAWMNSAGHRANILNCSFTEIGVGYATGGSYRTYWTQDFGTPR